MTKPIRSGGACTRRPENAWEPRKEIRLARDTYSAEKGKTPLDVAACFKRLVTIVVRGRGFADDLWQRRIHDRALRSHFDNNLKVAVRYVLDNPVRHALVASWEDWPFTHLHNDIGMLP